MVWLLGANTNFKISNSYFLWEPFKDPIKEHVFKNLLENEELSVTDKDELNEAFHHIYELTTENS